MSEDIYRCPKCGKSDDLTVEVTMIGSAKLSIDGGISIDFELDWDSTEFDENSVTFCGCGNEGPSSEFLHDEPSSH